MRDYLCTSSLFNPMPYALRLVTGGFGRHSFLIELLLPMDVPTLADDQCGVVYGWMENTFMHTKYVDPAVKDVVNQMDIALNNA